MNWIFVTDNVDGDKFYYDKNRVRKSGKYLYFLELGDIMKPKKGFSSSIRHIELDCSILRYKVLKLRGYKNSMGEGDIVGDYTPKDEWRYPPPNSTFEYMYKKICEEHQMDKDWLPNGQGTVTLPNGDKYVGEYKDDKKHGQGTLTSPDGDKYVGKFKDGIKHGQGTLTSLDRSKYVGEFRSGKKHGQGTLTSPDGDKYVGKFRNGKKHGQGTFSLSGSIIYKGKWKNGKFYGKGTFIFSNGNKGVGEFRDNKPWNITTYDKDGNYKWKYVKGVRQ